MGREVELKKKRKILQPYRNGRTLKEYQDRDGIELGYFNWKKRNEKQSYRFSKKYYINTYGNKVGIIKWGEYKKSMNKTSLMSFISRYGKVDGIYKYENYLKKINNSGCFYSKISQKMFWSVYYCLSDNKKEICRFAKLNGEEYFIVNQNELNNILVDFKCGNKIIEFDGDYWHSSKNQIKIDKLRNKFLLNKGYQILRIKENEYIINAEKTVKKCVKFINYG